MLILMIALVLFGTVYYYPTIRKLIESRSSTPLPIGLSDFYPWADRVITLAGLPNNESVQWALASLVLELDKTKGHVPPYELAIMLRKAAANQICSFIFQDIKTRQMAAKEEEAKAAAAIVKKQQEELQAKLSELEDVTLEANF